MRRLCNGRVGIVGPAVQELGMVHHTLQRRVGTLNAGRVVTATDTTVVNHNGTVDGARAVTADLVARRISSVLAVTALIIL